MGGLEHGGNPTFAGLPNGGYLQITGAWQQIPFASASPPQYKTMPSPANATGRRRFIYTTQPIWLSGNSAGKTMMYVPSGVMFETTARAALWFSAATAPAVVAAAQSSSSVIVPTNSSSSSSAGVVVTYGFLFACEEGT